MIITLPIKALSINKCWQGRRYKSKEYEQYEKDCFKLIRGEQVLGKVEINFKFYYVGKRLDVDNGLKPLLDILVKCQIIQDDRDVWKITAEKFISSENKIEIEINPYINN